MDTKCLDASIPKSKYQLDWRPNGTNIKAKIANKKGLEIFQCGGRGALESPVGLIWALAHNPIGNHGAPLKVRFWPFAAYIKIQSSLK